MRLRAIPLHTDNQKQTRVGQLEFLAGYVLTSPDPRFGGYSGLTLRRPEKKLIAVSDRGHWLSADMVFGDQGRLMGLRAASIAPLRDDRGRPVKIRDGLHDAEAVEQLDDGAFAVSFERRHRVWRYAPGNNLATAHSRTLIAGNSLSGLRINGGIEAMTPLDAGRMLLVAEDSYDAAGHHKGWLWQQDGVKALSYTHEGSFKPTDFARLLNGDVMALERHFSPIGVIAARLVRISADAITPGALLRGKEFARLAWPLAVDNFEGLAVGRGSNGETTVYLISDDNFNPLQDTLLLQFRLID